MALGVMRHVIIKAEKIIFVSLFFLFSCLAYANNLNISNVRLEEQNTSDSGAHANTIKVEFDISWDNSWRDSENRDTAWVFVKFSTDAGVSLRHALLETPDTSSAYAKNPSGYSRGSGTSVDIIVCDDNTTTAGGGYGCFIERSQDGSGTVNVHDVKLIWDYGQSSLSDTEANGLLTKIRVFGMEMVFVPTGAFYAGDGSDATGQVPSASGFTQGASDEDPWYVNDSDAMTTNGGEFYYTTDTFGEDDATGAAFDIQYAFPNGYDPFYIMKYELTQGQYRDFLNTLTRTQQNNRVQTDIAGNTVIPTYVMVNSTTVAWRQFIRCPTVLAANVPVTFGCDYALNGSAGDGTWNTSGDGEWTGMNYLKWQDLCAYADWAALRPITELEYEKACRGTRTQIYAEWAWGSTVGEGPASSVSNAGTSSETPNVGNINFLNCSPDGPFRSGCFADSTSTRNQSGASYWGAMELSGNVIEMCVTVGNTTGRGFTHEHGDGTLTTTSGNATCSSWPGYVSASAGVINAVGSGQRGSAWVSSSGTAPISYRRSGGYSIGTRDSSAGARLGRTDPGHIEYDAPS